ncbi:MAG: hypothetical protein K6U75_15635 [Firmicutes bacterium]|nr:hypothetical protein [Bacillota bacterium]
MTQRDLLDAMSKRTGVPCDRLKQSLPPDWLKKACNAVEAVGADYGDLLPAGDYAELGDFLEATLRLILPEHSSTQKPKRLPEQDGEPADVHIMEVWHYLPECVQKEMLAHMQTVLRLFAQGFTAPFKNEEEAKKQLLPLYPYRFRYPLLADSENRENELFVRFGNEVWRVYLEKPLRELSEWWLPVRLANAAWINVPDATAFLLYRYQPPYPSAVATFDTETRAFVSLTLPSWFSHEAVRAVWKAVHVNLHQSCATHYVAHAVRDFLPSGGILRGEQWKQFWNSVAPEQWRFSSVQASANALLRAKRKTLSLDDVVDKSVDWRLDDSVEDDSPHVFA